MITRDAPQGAVRQNALFKRIADKPEPQSVRSWLRVLAHGAEQDVAVRLEEAGYLEHVRGRVPWRQGRWVPVNPDWAFAPVLRARAALDPTRPLTAHSAALAGLTVACGLGFKLSDASDPGRPARPGRRRPARPGPPGTDRPDRGRDRKRRHVVSHLVSNRSGAGRSQVILRGRADWPEPPGPSSPASALHTRQSVFSRTARRARLKKRSLSRPGSGPSTSSPGRRSLASWINAAIGRGLRTRRRSTCTPSKWARSAGARRAACHLGRIVEMVVSEAHRHRERRQLDDVRHGERLPCLDRGADRQLARRRVERDAEERDEQHRPVAGARTGACQARTAGLRGPHVTPDAAARPEDCAPAA